MNSSVVAVLEPGFDEAGEAGFPSMSGTGDFDAAALFGGADEGHQKAQKVLFAAGECVPPLLGW